MIDARLAFGVAMAVLITSNGVSTWQQARISSQARTCADMQVGIIENKQFYDLALLRNDLMALRIRVAGASPEARGGLDELERRNEALGHHVSRSLSELYQLEAMRDRVCGEVDALSWRVERSVLLLTCLIALATLALSLARSPGGAAVDA